MGDVIDDSLTIGKPIQLSPILNLQNSIERLKKDSEESVGENVVSHLHELLIFLDNPDTFPNKYYPTTLKDKMDGYKKTNIHLNFKTIKKLLEQLSPTKNDFMVNFLMKDLFEYQGLDEIISFLEKMPIRKKFSFHYTNSKMKVYIPKIIKADIDLNSYIDFPVCENQLQSMTKVLSQLSIRHEYLFLIRSEDDFQSAEEMIKKYAISKHTFVPVYTGENMDFFKRNIFLSKEDILSQPISMKEIFIHKSLNVEYFGKLALLPSGAMYADIFSKTIGSIEEYSLLEILYKAMNLGNSWFNIRSYAPCSHCNYQWLCPSPSSYEVLLNKKNLCQIIHQ
jgi:pseudo-rSAM protein